VPISLFLFQVAATSLESSLLNYSAKEYFFNASLCHMCIDSLNAHHAIQGKML
jgi:alpha-soluble NSF attachment protein